ncbi:MAG: META domain-containing protein [Actinomycetia bacterium]|nr:META domain-containing protein [Actinomycetes bacterium]
MQRATTALVLDGRAGVDLWLAPALWEEDRAAGLLQVNGYTGCNRFGGGYSLGEGRFEADSLVSSAMSCGDENDRQADVFLAVLHGARVEVSDWQLSMVSDDGTVAKFQRSDVMVGDGIYRVEAVDGQSANSDASLLIRGEMFSAFVGCFAEGSVVREDGELVFSAPVSKASATTTTPEGYQGGALPESEPVDVLFGCEEPTEVEAALLAALPGGKAVPDEDRLTITSRDGSVIVLRHA